VKFEQSVDRLLELLDEAKERLPDFVKRSKSVTTLI
jgi:hypothetical protein